MTPPIHTHTPSGFCSLNETLPHFPQASPQCPPRSHWLTSLDLPSSLLQTPWLHKSPRPPAPSPEAASSPVFVSMATTCLVRASAAQCQGSPFYVEDNKDLKIAFHIQLYFDTWTWQKCIVAPVRIIRINLGVLTMPLFRNSTKM